MGQLIDGVWHPGWSAPAANGAFERQPTVFRSRTVEPVAGRYHLYVSYACPWAHRTMITRALRGLEDAVGLTIVDPHMGADGWPFKPSDPDPVGPSAFLRDVYLRAAPHFTGRPTVPVLWDRVAGTIVNNESREVMRLLDVALAPLARGESLAPAELVGEIERTLDAIYEPINNGVYRCGFARSQGAYDRAVTELFAALAHWAGARTT